MNRITFRVGIALLTFIVGVSAVSLWFFFDYSDVKNKKVDEQNSLSLNNSNSTEYSQAAQHKRIIRLSPAAFPQLPTNILRDIQSRNCTIPQAHDKTTPHNVISGELFRHGQTDWVVLCSVYETSSILIFRNGSTKNVSEIHLLDDDDYLQMTGNGQLEYSRHIEIVGKKYIMEHYKTNGGRKLPRINHEGINDSFEGKASMVHYFYKNIWFELQGAD